MTFKRATVGGTEIVLEGQGLHSGVPVVVRFVPSQNGIRFIWGSKAVEAVPENVRDTHRCTKLGEISTIEHVMAALAGYEVTDVDIVLSAPELPALDGSAAPYLRAFQEAGPPQVIAEVERPAPFARVFLHEGDSKLSISYGTGTWRYEFSCPGRWPEFQAFETGDVSGEFEQAIAPARTFGFESDVEQIQASGLARGLDLDKALLIGSHGYANASRYENEPARHKMLDAIGDLYLSRIPIRFLNVVAERTGHRMNVLAAQKLVESASN